MIFIDVVHLVGASFGVGFVIGSIVGIAFAVFTGRSECRRRHYQ